MTGPEMQKRIKDLESERDELETKDTELRGEITLLRSRLSATEAVVEAADRRTRKCRVDDGIGMDDRWCIKCRSREECIALSALDASKKENNHV